MDKVYILTRKNNLTDKTDILYVFRQKLNALKYLENIHNKEQKCDFIVSKCGKCNNVNEYMCSNCNYLLCQECYDKNIYVHDYLDNCPNSTNDDHFFDYHIQYCNIENSKNTFYTDTHKYYISHKIIH